MPQRQRKAVEPVTEQTEEQRRKTLLRKAYSEATQLLRESHQQTFNRLYAERAAALGVSWSPRPSAEEKASAEFDALIEAHPFLLDRVEVLREGRTPDEGPGDEG